ncbi:MAG: hypothetical protein HOV68_10950 [Streptomycetaceae bacterium]|nr:hypothetical protein [Streptomycetaceae bacterium]
MTSDDFPIPDDDEQSVAALEQYVRTLSEDDLATVLDHERRHGNRPGVVLMFAQRLRHVNQGLARPTGPGT